MAPKKKPGTIMNLEHKIALLERPAECPWCGGRLKMSIPRKATVYRNGVIVALTSCLRCKRRWRERYELADITGAGRARHPRIDR